MSVMAVGPAIHLDGPPPVAPPYSLLSLPGVRIGEGDERWLNGANLWGYPPGTPVSWEPCSTGTFREKEEGGEVPVPRFDAFGLYLPLTCTAASITNDFEGFKRRAELTLEATLSWGVARALAAGVDGSNNPFISDANMVELNTGTATVPGAALSFLELALGETGRGGIIHAPPEVAAAWGFDKLETGEAVRTANGTLVSIDGGYSGITPVGESAPAAGTSWAYVTGPVEARISEFQVVGDVLNGTLDTSNNEVTIRAEAFALATWDTALQAGVLVDWLP